MSKDKFWDAVKELEGEFKEYLKQFEDLKSTGDELVDQMKDTSKYMKDALSKEKLNPETEQAAKLLENYMRKYVGKHKIPFGKGKEDDLTGVVDQYIELLNRLIRKSHGEEIKDLRKWLSLTDSLIKTLTPPVEKEISGHETDTGWLAEADKIRDFGKNVPTIDTTVEPNGPELVKNRVKELADLLTKINDMLAKIVPAFLQKINDTANDTTRIREEMALNQTEGRDNSKQMDELKKIEERLKEMPERAKHILPKDKLTDVLKRIEALQQLVESLLGSKKHIIPLAKQVGAALPDDLNKKHGTFISWTHTYVSAIKRVISVPGLAFYLKDDHRKKFQGYYDRAMTTADELKSQIKSSNLNKTTEDSLIKSVDTRVKVVKRFHDIFEKVGQAKMGDKVHILEAAQKKLDSSSMKKLAETPKTTMAEFNDLEQLLNAFFLKLDSMIKNIDNYTESHIDDWISLYTEGNGLLERGKELITKIESIDETPEQKGVMTGQINGTNNILMIAILRINEIVRMIQNPIESLKSVPAQDDDAILKELRDFLSKVEGLVNIAPPDGVKDLQTAMAKVNELRNESNEIYVRLNHEKELPFVFWTERAKAIWAADSKLDQYWALLKAKAESLGLTVPDQMIQDRLMRSNFIEIEHFNELLEKNAPEDVKKEAQETLTKEKSELAQKKAELQKQKEDFILEGVIQPGDDADVFTRNLVRAVIIGSQSTSLCASEISAALIKNEVKDGVFEKCDRINAILKSLSANLKKYAEGGAFDKAVLDEFQILKTATYLIHRKRPNLATNHEEPVRTLRDIMWMRNVEFEVWRENLADDELKTLTLRESEMSKGWYEKCSDLIVKLDAIHNKMLSIADEAGRLVNDYYKSSHSKVGFTEFSKRYYESMKTLSDDVEHYIATYPAYIKQYTIAAERFALWRFELYHKIFEKRLMSPDVVITFFNVFNMQLAPVYEINRALVRKTVDRLNESLRTLYAGSDKIPHILMPDIPLESDKVKERMELDFKEITEGLSPTDIELAKRFKKRAFELMEQNGKK